MFLAELMLIGSKLQRVGVANKNALISMFASTLGSNSRSERDRSYLDFLAVVTSECKYGSTHADSPQCYHRLHRSTTAHTLWDSHINLHR